RLREIFGAPNAMQGPPVTWQVTSPTSLESSDSISVLTMVPRISSALARVELPKRTPMATTTTATTVRRVCMFDHLHGFGRQVGNCVNGGDIVTTIDAESHLKSCVAGLRPR